MGDDTTLRMWDHAQRRNRKTALRTVETLERQLADVRRELENQNGSVTLAVGAARRAAPDFAELIERLTTLVTLIEWRFAAEDHPEGGTG